MCSIYKRYHHFALLAVGRPDVPAGAVAVTRSVFAAPAGALGVGFHLSIASILIAKPLSSSICVFRSSCCALLCSANAAVSVSILSFNRFSRSSPSATARDILLKVVSIVRDISLAEVSAFSAAVKALLAAAAATFAAAVAGPAGFPPCAARCAS